MKKRCLLIMPLSFYSMANQIQAALNGCGYEVTICNDRYPNNVFTKILWKIGLTKILYRKTYNYITKHFLKDKKYNICIIIKGAGINSALIDKVYTVCPHIIGYNFDSFAFHPLSLTWYRLVDEFSTFDYRDAHEYDLKIIELYSAIGKTEDVVDRMYDISVIQKIHSGRLSYTINILSLLSPKHSYIYLLESNMATMALNFLMHPSEYIKLWRYIHFKPLFYEEYVDVLRRSKFTLDFAHPKQSGITMRCFEAASCKTKIITNNQNIYRNEHFANDTVIYIDADKKYTEEEIQNIKQKFLLSTHSINLYHRTINDFIMELLK